METIFIGVDISKDTLDYAFCIDISTEIKQSCQVGNSVKGICKMINHAKKYKKPLWFCFEHTGNYGLLLAHQLQSLGLNYSMVPAIEIKRSMGMVRGKNDAVDAIRIAEYAAIHSHKLKPMQLPGEGLLKIKSLLTYRSQLVKMLRQFKNSRKSYLVSSGSIDVGLILNDIDNNISSLLQKIDEMEKQVADIISSDQEIKSNFKKACTVKGIGLIIAAYMLVYTNNFTAFENPRKFNCYAGLAPFEYSSGSSIRGKTKTSSLRNKTMKSLLYNGANSAANNDYQLKMYYKRKRQEGKPHMLIMNNIACKLVYRVFAVVNRQEPYVNFSN